MGILAAAAVGDRVLLKDGRVFVGKVTESEGKVLIEMVYGTVSFPAAEVEDIVRMPTPADMLEWQLSQIDRSDPKALFQVAEWARDNDLPHQADELLRQVLALQGDHVRSRKLLGYLKAEGKWLKVPAALQLARSKLAAGQYKALLDELLPAIEEVADDARMRLEVKEIEAHCRLQTRQFDLAQKCFESLTEKAAPAESAGYSAIAEILAAHPDGMYVVTESYPPLAMLLGDPVDAVKPGPASLAQPKVLAAALRDRAKQAIALGQQLMAEARKFERTEPEAAKSRYEQAKKHFDTADLLVPRIARSFRVEIARRRIAMIRTGMNVQAEVFDRLMGELGKKNLTPAAYKEQNARMLRALNHVHSDLNAILELAEPFERELVLEITDANGRLGTVNALREILTKELNALR
ncbi:MAG: hypothetical protein AMJ81_00240 [Phycisphaerae bacterium SM23_33]|nr:MAG: hypothetical protein AMJ81_00240 [Phycisphaerae bacterium SM23_33]